MLMYYRLVCECRCVLGRRRVTGFSINTMRFTRHDFGQCGREIPAWTFVPILTDLARPTFYTDADDQRASSINTRFLVSANGSPSPIASVGPPDLSSVCYDGERYQDAEQVVESCQQR